MYNIIYFIVEEIEQCTMIEEYVMSNMLKPSFYNKIYEINEKKWLFNTFNLGLREIDDEIEKILSCSIIDKELYSEEMDKNLVELEDAGFIIQSQIDELKMLRYIYNTDKYNKDYLTITILPTLDCNCECYYCFERENKARTSFSKNQSFDLLGQSLLDFVNAKIRDTKNLSIAWFGGEPLLSFDVIEKLSIKFIELANKYGVHYTSSLTTNGYYLTDIPNIIERLKKCQIDSFQITLDGAPEDHNRIRYLKGAHKETFDKMLDGIILLYKNEMNISVRINVSKKNLVNMPKLFDILEENNLKNLKIYFGQLIDYSDKDNSDVYLDQVEYGALIERLYRTLRKRGFRYGLDDHYPSSARPCIANRIDTAVVDCYGNIYKCRSQVGEFEKTIGNVRDLENQTVDEAMREINWLEWTPFRYAVCRECKIFPICMGGCPFTLYDNDDALPICDEWKYNLDFFVRQKILDMEEKNDE